MKWHYTKNGDKPKCLNGRKETIPCIVERYGFDLYYWDPFNDSWNDHTDDDYVCDFEKVDRWAYVEDEKYEDRK